MSCCTCKGPRQCCVTVQTWLTISCALGCQQRGTRRWSCRKNTRWSSGGNCSITEAQSCCKQVLLGACGRRIQKRHSGQSRKECDSCCNCCVAIVGSAPSALTKSTIACCRSCAPLAAITSGWASAAWG